MNRFQESSTPNVPFDYHIERWGKPYFNIATQGHVAVVDPQTSRACSLLEIVKLSQQQKLDTPVLLRFPFITRHRLARLYRAFQQAIQEFQYPNQYQLVYPVKVNQNANVVNSILNGCEQNSVGLEAGSKAELILTIAEAEPDTPIFYNGFKDRESIEMAVRASRCGRNITIIIEKPNEIDMIIDVCRKLEHAVRLGIRIKLASRGAGHWEQSGGLRSKFGLFVPQLLAAVEQLKTAHLLDSLNLLHFHLGSQISDILKIKASIIEATRIYTDLMIRGVPLTTLDVGGGLAVDYSGEKSTAPSSMNYSLQEYANDIVYYIKRVCDQAKVQPPEIVTESGRAVVAHHSVLVIPVLGSSNHEINASEISESFDETDLSLQPLVELKETLHEVNAHNLIECFHDAQQAIEMSLQLFASGMMSLQNRAIAEKLFWKVCCRIREHFNSVRDVPANLGKLKELFAETFVGNFSVFQSIKDHWAIHQLFPVMPIQKLLERPEIHAVLGDITCDSDGRMGCFIGSHEGDTPSAIPLHALDQNQPYFLAVFLTGAYQEAIGQQHNLLGKTNAVSIELGENGPEIISVEPSMTMERVLQDQGYRIQERFDSLSSSLKSTFKSTHSEDVEFLRRSLQDNGYLNSRSAVAPLDETLASNRQLDLKPPHHLTATESSS